MNRAQSIIEALSVDQKKLIVALRKQMPKIKLDKLPKDLQDRATKLIKKGTGPEGYPDVYYSEQDNEIIDIVDYIDDVQSPKDMKAHTDYKRVIG